MSCAHGRLEGEGMVLRLYGGRWPGRVQGNLSFRQFRRLYLWHWDHMQCVYNHPEDYTMKWWDWYEALKTMCLDYGFPVPVSINVVGLGK